MRLSILELRKIYNLDIWYDCLEPKYHEKRCYTDTFSFIVHIKTDDLAKDVEARINTSNYESNKQLSKAKNNKVIGLMMG